MEGLSFRVEAKDYGDGQPPTWWVVQLNGQRRVATREEVILWAALEAAQPKKVRAPAKASER